MSNKENTALATLTDYLPEEYKEDVALCIRPTPEELLETAKALPKEYQLKLSKMVAKTRTKKAGLRVSSGGFTPTEIKVFHGTGSDPRRPKKCVPGELYSVEGRLLGESFTGIPIHIYEARSKFPPRDSTGDTGSSAPDCVSCDRVHGSKYGACDACTFKPWTSSERTCSDEIVIHFIDAELSGVYMIRFAKTSTTFGNNIVKLASKDVHIWDRAFTITPTEKEGHGNRWYVLKTTATDQTTPPELNDIIAQFSAIIDHDVYYPKLARTYQQFESQADAPGENLDVDALMDSDSDNEDLAGAM